MSGVQPQQQGTCWRVNPGPKAMGDALIRISAYSASRLRSGLEEGLDFTVPMVCLSAIDTLARLGCDHINALYKFTITYLLMYVGGLMSPMQRCFSDLVCQPLVTSYVIYAYLCLAMLHVWTLEYQHMMLCV